MDKRVWILSYLAQIHLIEVIWVRVRIREYKFWTLLASFTALSVGLLNHYDLHFSPKHRAVWWDTVNERFGLLITYIYIYIYIHTQSAMSDVDNLLRKFRWRRKLHSSSVMYGLFCLLLKKSLCHAMCALQWRIMFE